MWRKSLNDLAKRIANLSLYLYLPGITRDQTLTRTRRMQHFEVAISQSLDHCYTSCWDQDQTYLCCYLLSQFSSKPTEGHLQKVLYIVRYLSSSKELCIVYSGTGDSNGLCAYSDTDWAGDVETSRSTTGYAIFLGNGIVSWLSRQQQRVTLSSTEAEYCGMTKTTKQLC